MVLITLKVHLTILIINQYVIVKYKCLKIVMEECIEYFMAHIWLAVRLYYSNCRYKAVGGASITAPLQKKTVVFLMQGYCFLELAILKNNNNINMWYFVYSHLNFISRMAMIGYVIHLGCRTWCIFPFAILLHI